MSTVEWRSTTGRVNDAAELEQPRSLGQDASAEVNMEEAASALGLMHQTRCSFTPVPEAHAEATTGRALRACIN